MLGDPDGMSGDGGGGVGGVGGGDSLNLVVLSGEGFREFFRLAIPGGLMMSCEAWAFDLTAVFAGLLHDSVALDAHVCLLNLSGFTFLAFPLGISIATTIRVGNLLGGARPDQACLATRISVVLGTAFMGLTGVAVFVARDVVGNIFTDDVAVVRQVALLVPVMAVFQAADGFQGCAAGSLRGMGRQTLLAGANVVGFWLCGMSVGFGLAFYGMPWVGLEPMGVLGLWVGLLVGVTATSLITGRALGLTQWSRWVPDGAQEIREQGIGMSDI
jgi:MATE family multidrug resistance protein